ncbi:6ec725cf-b8a6-43d0-9544-816bd4b7eac4 [Thermothielavioides terrestris]|uniref:6ec725cf-b8a6-43d0-9544-816bd4b7eac4 n=1 Tax=Thermothielavioides terrestris TaxID=2587410 RepID=A0A3S4AQ16_9PEZI|nr:6ec725cf-b8a6-43d0-9544-816bd4b7eac4 [Thermothielavioides terrestris]
MSSSNPSATDIITYIGVPLAVLGVLPILYNTAVTLAAVSRIKRMLRHSRLTALTRSDVVNRVIEVELPRYAVRPWDRFADRAQYWTLSRHPSSIPGGSWTTFNWQTNVIGFKTQRVEYADQLRQPQVEVAFDELVCYLLDLGAVPDPQGWRLLRSADLWTPVGCALMLSPDGKEKALTIAPLDGSDGFLSLAVTWAGPWTTRDYTHLPPYWVRLPPPPPPPPAPSTAEEEGPTKAEASEDSSSAAEAERSADLAREEASSSLKKPSLDSARQRGITNSSNPITCQISADGIVTALSQDPDRQFASTVHLDSLYIEHLRVRPGQSAGAWFASAATAYGTSSQTILWNYKIPDDILRFARRETVPCGVLVLLGVVDEAATPEWATRQHGGDDDHARQLDLFARRHREQRAAMEAEARMPPAQRAAAVQQRVMRENQERLQDMQDRLRAEAQRKETRMMEALQSPKWDTKLVAEHNLAWLKTTGAVSGEFGVKEVVGTLLHRMVLDGEFTSRLCRMLDLWKAWAENGGMRKSDLAALQEDQTTFAYATLLVAIIEGTSSALEGTLSMDLQESSFMVHHLDD